MRPIKRILLATDFSDSAENAARFATALAADREAELHVLTVHLMNALIAETSTKLYEEHKKRLEDYDPAPDLKVVKTIEHGATAAPVVADYAREHDIDLIAIGTHSRQGLARFFLGSVAAEVVRTAPVSVLVTGPGPTAAPEDYKCILVPVDFSDPSVEALREAATIAETHGARLVAAHVVDTDLMYSYSQVNTEKVDQLARQALAGAVDKAGVSSQAEQVIVSGNVHTRIAEVAREQGADLIVMGASGRGMVERLLLGSATNRVLRTAHCPVLVHRGEEVEL